MFLVIVLIMLTIFFFYYEMQLTWLINKWQFVTFIYLHFGITKKNLIIRFYILCFPSSDFIPSNFFYDAWIMHSWNCKLVCYFVIFLEMKGAKMFTYYWKINWVGNIIIWIQKGNSEKPHISNNNKYYMLIWYIWCWQMSRVMKNIEVCNVISAHERSLMH